MWQATGKGEVRFKPNLGWMRVDDVREKMREDGRYIDQVAQKRRVHEALAPFDLTPEFTLAFRRVLTDHPSLRPLGCGPSKSAGSQMSASELGRRRGPARVVNNPVRWVAPKT